MTLRCCDPPGHPLTCHCEIPDAPGSLANALKQADARGWTVSINFTGATDGFVFAHRGDCNCPYQGLYDKDTGHGYESTDEITFETLEELAARIEALPDYGTAWTDGTGTAGEGR